MGYVSRHLWDPHRERLQECFNRIDAAAGTFGPWQGHSGDGRPYHFHHEVLYFDEVNVIVSFEHEDNDHLRYSARITDNTIARRTLAAGPTGLIDVRNGLDTALGDIDAALDKIIKFLDSSVKIITRADPHRPRGLSDLVAEFRRFTTS